MANRKINIRKIFSVLCKKHSVRVFNSESGKIVVKCGCGMVVVLDKKTCSFEQY